MFEEHAFYCMNCGHRGLPLARRTSHQHERFHRKKLYDKISLEDFKQEYINFQNTIKDCKIQLMGYSNNWAGDIEEFWKNFNEGVYANEVEDSVAHCRSARKW